ncbi:MAG: polysaccharide pyruvyl transferase family protein [Candidatus Wallbacteria bacterium]|nr:polysaccharide pyruvyl transferase family protein [Candidatus Wallbacteria bacterium]
MEKPLKVLLAGYYGFSNFGDEALLYSTRSLLSRTADGLGRELEFSLLDQSGHAGFFSIPRRSAYQAIKAIASSDLVVFGGGGIFQNQTSNRSLVYYLSILRLSRLLCRPTLLLGTGFIPVNGWFWRYATASSVKKSAVAVRDPESLTFLESRSVKAVLSADLLFNYPITVVRSPESANKPGNIYFNVRRFTDDSEERGFKELLVSLSQRGFSLTGLSLAPEDTACMRPLLKDQSLKISGFHVMDKSPHEFIPLFQPDSIFVGMRLHSLILATLFGIPFVAITKDPKISAYAAECGCVSLDLSKPEAVFGAIENVAENFRTECRNIRTVADSFTRRAIVNEEIAMQVMQGIVHL